MVDNHAPVRDTRLSRASSPLGGPTVHHVSWEASGTESSTHERPDPGCCGDFVDFCAVCERLSSLLAWKVPGGRGPGAVVVDQSGVSSDSCALDLLSQGFSSVKWGCLLLL